MCFLIAATSSVQRDGGTSPLNGCPQFSRLWCPRQPHDRIPGTSRWSRRHPRTKILFHLGLRGRICADSHLLHDRADKTATPVPEGQDGSDSSLPPPPPSFQGSHGDTSLLGSVGRCQEDLPTRGAPPRNREGILGDVSQRCTRLWVLLWYLRLHVSMETEAEGTWSHRRTESGVYMCGRWNGWNYIVDQFLPSRRREVPLPD